MFVCPRCNQEFSSYSLLGRHTSKMYGIKGEQLYRELHNITDTPTCKCGCGTTTKWRSDRGYGEYVTGHNSKGENNIMFGKTHSNSAKESISKKRKEKFANGEYEFINTVDWSKLQTEVWQQDGYREKMKVARETKGWRKKLSAAKTGKNNPWYGKKRPEHSELMKTPEMLRKIFSARSMTDIEQIVAQQLDNNHIEYYSQFFINDGGDVFSYDFKIKGKNVLIEVDGDYWHGGPGVDIHVPFVNEIQDKDMLKTKLAEQKGYTVIRLWGSAVKENPLIVMQEILPNLVD